jgi:hypothetical protein
MNQDGFSGFESCLLKGVVCGYEHFRNSARNRPIEIRRHGRNGILMGRYKFSVRPTTNDTHDARAFGPAVSVCAHLFDFASELQSRNVLRSARRRRIST